MERMNRRTVIKGASATVAALAVPAIASANNETETLASLIARHKALYEATTIEGRKVDAIDVQLKASELPLPPELIAPINIAGHKPLTPSNSQTGWTLEGLDSYLASATFFHCTRAELPNGGYTLECVDLPLPPATLSHMRRVRSVRESYDASLEAHYAPFNQRQEAWEASLDTVDAALADIIAYRATSWATLHLKTDYLRTVEAIAKRTDFETALAITESLIADILALTANA